VMVNGNWQATELGSPLLANIYLDAFEQAM
jgi:hypothetical protein